MQRTPTNKAGPPKTIKEAVKGFEDIDKAHSTEEFQLKGDSRDSIECGNLTSGIGLLPVVMTVNPDLLPQHYCHRCIPTALHAFAAASSCHLIFSIIYEEFLKKRKLPRSGHVGVWIGEWCRQGQTLNFLLCSVLSLYPTALRVKGGGRFI